MRERHALGSPAYGDKGAARPSTRLQSVPRRQEVNAMRYRRFLIGASAMHLTMALGMTAMGGLAASGALAQAKPELKLVDYWGDEPAKTVWRTAYSSCGEQIGATVSVESEPGNFLVPKALQMVASKTLPDVLMFDNPDMQQVAVSG